VQNVLCDVDEFIEEVKKFCCEYKIQTDRQKKCISPVFSYRCKTFEIDGDSVEKRGNLSD
jgi:hypothetical protein